MKRSWLIGAVVVLLVAAVGYFGYRRMKAQGTATASAQQTAVVERGSFEKTVSSTGNLVSGAEVAVAFGTAGTVAEVPVAVGDKVEAGQLLAVIETRDLELSLATAEASLTSAATGLSSARTSLADLQDGPDASALEEAKIQVEQAKDRLWGVQAQRDSTCGRVQRGQGQQAECDSAQSSVLSSEGAVRSAELAYNGVLAGASTSELSAARDKVAQAEAQLASARAQADQARLKLEDAKLVAPIAGTVTSLTVKAGQTATAGQSVVTVSDLSALEVVISVAESDVSDVAVGQTAQVTLDAFPGKQVAGKVTAVAPTAAVQSGVVLFPVTVRLDPSDVGARPGMTVNVDISTVSAQNVLVIPSRAVITTDQGTFVLRVSRAGGAPVADSAQTRVRQRRLDGTPFAPGSFGQRRAGALAGAVGGAVGSAGVAAAERVSVTLGVANDTQVEVTDGLAEGDVVLVANLSSGGSSGNNNFQRGPGMMPIGGGFIGDRP